MIYNRPHDISWRLLPSLKFLNKEKRRAQSSKKTDNLIKAEKSVSTLPEKNVDIILDGKPTFVKELEVDENTIIDITKMPVIEGVPILQFPSEPYEEKEADSVKPDAEKLVSPPAYVEKNRKPKKKEAVTRKPKNPYFLKIASFFIMLYAGTVLAFIIPIRPTYSEAEKRDLAKFPEFSINSFADGDYFDDISTWFSDTFPFRDFFTRVDSKLKEFYGINKVAIHGEVGEGDDIPDIPITTEPATELPTVPPTQTETQPPQTTAPQVAEPPKRPDIAMQDLGAIIVAGDSAYEYYSFSSSLAARYVTGVNAIKDKAKPTGNVYSLVVPTSIDVTLNDELRKEVKSSDQRKALDFFNSSITNAVPVNNILDVERQHRDEYIYFRTDHHWTALGAYYAYNELCHKKGITPVPLSQYSNKSYINFTGTFYSNAAQSSTLKENADYVTTYIPFNNNTCTILKTDGTSHNIDIVRDVSEFGDTLKYLTFIGGDNPLTTITNHDNPNGETCVVIKDSYGNAFVPFLVPHYSTIYVIDPRYFDGSLENFTKDKIINDVIFISNISTTRNSIFIESLENLVR